MSALRTLQLEAPRRSRRRQTRRMFPIKTSHESSHPIPMANGLLCPSLYSVAQDALGGRDVRAARRRQRHCAHLQTHICVHSSLPLIVHSAGPTQTLTAAK